MTKLAGLGALTVFALAAPVLAVLAMLGLAGNTIACTTVASATISPNVPIPAAARLWIALAHQACPRLPEPWIAAVMDADSGFDPTHTGSTGRGLITIGDADWQALYGGPPTTDRDRDGTPDIGVPGIEAPTVAALLCRLLGTLDTDRVTHPDSAATQQLTALDELALAHRDGTQALEEYPRITTAARAYLTDVQTHTAAWTAPSGPATGLQHPVSQAVSATVDPSCVASLGSVGSVVIPPDTPAQVATAIKTALALVGTRSGFTNRCDHLACLAYGYANSGYDSASGHWAAMVATGHAHPGDHCPPAGAFMFWATRGPNGHVSLVVASDPGCDPTKIEVVSNDVLNGQTGFTGGVYLVTLARIESGFVSRAGYLGWSDPVCAGSKTSTP